jgi:hypothetical protein
MQNKQSTTGKWDIIEITKFEGMSATDSKANLAMASGDTPFHKAGEEYGRLRTLMEAHGRTGNMKMLTARVICNEDPYFLAFKPNSFKATITSIKKEFAERQIVEATRKLFLPVFSNLTSYTTGGKPKADDDDGVKPPAAPVSAIPATKRPANNVHQMQGKAKKQALATKNDDNHVVVQSVAWDNSFREKLIVVVTIPDDKNVDLSRLMVAFADGSNGSALTVWVPRGKKPTDMDMVKSLLSNMPEITPQDSTFFVHALEIKMMEERRNAVLDPFHIVLDKACDVNNLPSATVGRSGEDIVCCIVLNVPSLNA